MVVGRHLEVGRDGRKCCFCLMWRENCPVAAHGCVTGEREVMENVPVNLKKTNLSKLERVSRDTGAEMGEGEEGGCTISGTG